MAVSFKKKLKTLRQQQNDDIVRSFKPLLTKAQKLEKQIKQITKLKIKPEIKREALHRLATKSRDDFKLAPNLYSAFDHRAYKTKIQNAINELDDDKDKKNAQKEAAAEEKDFGEEAKATTEILRRGARVLNESVKNGLTDGGAALLLGVSAVVTVINKYNRK